MLRCVAPGLILVKPRLGRDGPILGPYCDAGVLAAEHHASFSGSSSCVGRGRSCNGCSCLMRRVRCLQVGWAGCCCDGSGAGSGRGRGHSTGVTAAATGAAPAVASTSVGAAAVSVTAVSSFLTQPRTSSHRMFAGARPPGRFRRPLSARDCFSCARRAAQYAASLVPGIRKGGNESGLQSKPGALHQKGSMGAFYKR